MNEAIPPIRSFNRFYTSILGLLQKHLLNSPHTLLEARILYEIHHAQRLTASQLTSILNIDKGYLSRILKQMQVNEYILKITCKKDRRRLYISLTPKGESEFQELNRKSDEQIYELTKHLKQKEILQLAAHMNSIKSLLSEPKKEDQIK